VTSSAPVSEFLLLFGIGLFGALCAIPYSLSIVARPGRIHATRLHFRIISQLAQTALLLAIATGFGLWAAHSIGLGAPILEYLLTHRAINTQFWQMLFPAVASGVVAAFMALLGDLFFFSPRLSFHAQNLETKPALWKGLLASIYGGVTEEILSRLFIFSVLGWLLSRIPPPRTTLTSPELWVVNFVVAVLFGLGHLPVMRATLDLTPLAVVRSMALNGLPSLIFGWLYWQYGLEAAMIAHFCADIILQFATSLLRNENV
jgi:hypothetical protein